MATENNNLLTKVEFEGWAMEIKASFNAIEDTLAEHTIQLNEHTKILNEHTRILNSHTEILEKIAKGIQDMVHEQKAMTQLYYRLDYRDHIFANKLGLDLKKVDEEFERQSI